MQRRERRWIPALAVLGVIAVTVLGGYVVAAALSEPAGPPVAVGGVVGVQPLSGWDVAGTAPVGGLAFARLTRGSGNLDVVVVQGFGGDAGALAKEYVDRVLSGQLSRLSVSSDLRSATLQEGLAGQRFTYVGVTDNGSSVEGEVTLFVSPGGDGAVFDGWAPEGLLTYVDGDIHTMTERAVFA